MELAVDGVTAACAGACKLQQVTPRMMNLRPATGAIVCEEMKVKASSSTPEMMKGYPKAAWKEMPEAVNLYLD